MSEARVQSVDRSLYIMEHLATRQPQTLVELAAKLGVHKSTVSRLVATLALHQMVEGVDGGYRLGIGATRLSAARGRGFDLVSVAKSSSIALAKSFALTVNLSVRDGSHALCLDETHGFAGLQFTDYTRQRLPLNITASGLVLLAWEPASQQQQLLHPLLDARGQLPRTTSHTVREPSEIVQQLSRVVTSGYAIARDQLHDGLTVVAAPLRSAKGSRHNDNVIAALSMAGASEQFHGARQSAVLDALVHAAHAISHHLGYLGPASEVST